MSVEDELVPEDERALRSLELAERHFPPHRLKLVADYFGVQVDNPVLLPTIALCARHGFSPTEGLVNLLPRRVFADDGVTVEQRWEPVIGRDGLHTLALRTLDRPFGYRGMRSGVLYRDGEKLTLAYTGDHMIDPVISGFEQEYPPPASSSDGLGGDPVGAWAQAYFAERPAFFYYADIAEHGRTEQDEQGREVWQDFWRFTAAMILKCAQSYVLRVGGGISGFVPVDELRSVRSWQEGVRLPGGVFLDGRDAAAPVPEFDWTTVEDEELRERLRAAIATANERDPFAWSPAKQAMVLPNRSADELREVVGQIEAANALAAEPPAPEPPPPARRRARRARSRRARARRAPRARRARGRG